VIDRFGSDIRIKKVDESHFSTEVQVAINSLFFSWIYQFAGKAVVISLEAVVAQMKQLVKQQSHIYEMSAL